MKKLQNVLMAWDNGEGPWGKTGSAKPKTPRNAGGPAGGPQRPELEDLFALYAGELRSKFGGFWKNDNGDGPAVLRIVGAVFAIWVLSGFYIVAPEQAGVELRFGKYTETTEPGLNYHFPWPIETVMKPQVTRENVVQIGFRNDGLGDLDVPDESHMLTGDENIVDLDFTVRWKVADPQAYLFNVTDVDDTVASAAESMMREVIGQHPVDDALTGNKKEIQDIARTKLQKALDGYKAGVLVTAVELQQVNPPNEVIEAFRDVQAARADAEKVINESKGYANQILPLARGQAAQITQQAEAYTSSTVAAAVGAAARFNAQVQAYQSAPQVTRDRLYMETMEQVMRDTQKVVLTGKGGNGVLPFLPLDRMMKEGR